MCLHDTALYITMIHHVEVTVMYDDSISQQSFMLMHRAVVSATVPLWHEVECLQGPAAIQQSIVQPSGGPWAQMAG